MPLAGTALDCAERPAAPSGALCPERIAPTVASMGQGILMVVLVTAMLAAGVSLALCQREIKAALRWAWHRVSPPPDPPAGPPIERIARDARRVRAQLRSLAAGTPMSRRQALWGAYDNLLADACRAVGVPDTLTGMPPGTERDVERLRIEHELDLAGVRLGA
jgi:hypothetical protein